MVVFLAVILRPADFDKLVATAEESRVLLFRGARLCDSRLRSDYNLSGRRGFQWSASQIGHCRDIFSPRHDLACGGIISRSKGVASRPAEAALTFFQYVYGRYRIHTH